MSDLFQESVTGSYVRSVFEVMHAADWHIYQVLTKRAERMNRLVSKMPSRLRTPEHMWLGVSVENKKHGLPRVDLLRETPVSVRFLSIEPLLEDLGRIDLRGIDWVIVGGESGFGARKMEAPWVVSIRDQCLSAGVPFFFKQWGGLQKGRFGRLLDGHTYDEYPHFASAHEPSREYRRNLCLALARKLNLSINGDLANAA